MAAWKQRLTAFSGRHLLLEGKSHMVQACFMFEGSHSKKGIHASEQGGPFAVKRFH